MFSRLLALTSRFLRSDEGPSTVEYAVILALILTVIVGVVSAVGKSNSKTYKKVRKAMIAKKATGS